MLASVADDEVDVDVVGNIIVSCNEDTFWMALMVVPLAWATLQSLCANNNVFKLITSSLSNVAWVCSCSLSVAKNSTRCCRSANHCFFRCRHLRAAILLRSKNWRRCSSTGSLFSRLDRLVLLFWRLFAAPIFGKDPSV